MGSFWSGAARRRRIGATALLAVSGTLAAAAFGMGVAGNPGLSSGPRENVINGPAGDAPQTTRPTPSMNVSLSPASTMEARSPRVISLEPKAHVIIPTMVKPGASSTSAPQRQRPVTVPSTNHPATDQPRLPRASSGADDPARSQTDAQPSRAGVEIRSDAAPRVDVKPPVAPAPQDNVPKDDVPKDTASQDPGTQETAAPTTDPTPTTAPTPTPESTQGSQTVPLEPARPTPPAGDTISTPGESPSPEVPATPDVTTEPSTDPVTPDPVTPDPVTRDPVTPTPTPGFCRIASTP